VGVVAHARSSKGRAACLALAAALGGLALILVLGRSDAAAAGTQCPTFRVLHNDRIGAVLLPAGTYGVKLTRGSKLSCAQASGLFARFLEDYDGVLPGGWRVVPKGKGKARFVKPGERGFAVSRQGGGGGGGNSRLGHLCPGSFRVLHNDRIGPLSFPAGVYQIYIPRHSVLPCQRASSLFASFLEAPNDVLPGKWQMKSRRAVFFTKNQPRTRRFRVDPGT
jgi:hypothetical protein